MPLDGETTVSNSAKPRRRLSARLFGWTTAITILVAFVAVTSLISQTPAARFEGHETCTLGELLDEAGFPNDADVSLSTGYAVDLFAVYTNEVYERGCVFPSLQFSYSTWWDKLTVRLECDTPIEILSSETEALQVHRLDDLFDLVPKWGKLLEHTAPDRFFENANIRNVEWTSDGMTFEIEFANHGPVTVRIPREAKCSLTAAQTRVEQMKGWVADMWRRVTSRAERQPEPAFK